MARILHNLGLLSGLDRAMLLAYCKSFEQWVAAVRMAENEGTVIHTANGTPVQSPYVGIANRALTNFTRIAVEFGLTPAARSRVQVPQMGEGMDEDGGICSVPVAARARRTRTRLRELHWG